MACSTESAGARLAKPERGPGCRLANRRPRVALAHGGDRVGNLTVALELVLGEIDWATRQHVVVKPNLVVHDRPAAITHRDALATVLRLVRQRYDGRLSIAEGSAVQPTMAIFTAQGYGELAKEYRAELVDLNADATEAVTVLGPRGKAQTVRLARTVLDSDCRISLALPKTHDTVLVTLAIKNMVMGSVTNRELTSRVGRGQRVLSRLRQRLASSRNDKLAMHQGYAGTHINLALLAPRLMPHLAVIDGFQGMEGAGPTEGRPVPWGIAVASTDALAADCLTARLMGFEPGQVGYLAYCAQLGLGTSDVTSMDILSPVPLESVSRTFQPHPTHAHQADWQCEAAARWLARARQVAG